MTDRFTECRSPDGACVIDRGRVSRQEIIRQYREHYERQLEEARAALSVSGKNDD